MRGREPSDVRNRRKVERVAGVCELTRIAAFAGLLKSSSKSDGAKRVNSHVRCEASEFSADPILERV
jgi:hypothetical protein